LFEGEKSQGTFAYVGVTRHKIKILQTETGLYLSRHSYYLGS